MSCIKKRRGRHGQQQRGSEVGLHGTSTPALQTHDDACRYDAMAVGAALHCSAPSPAPSSGGAGAGIGTLCAR